jgi:hypothetical protein
VSRPTILQALREFLAEARRPVAVAELVEYVLTRCPGVTSGSVRAELGHAVFFGVIRRVAPGMYEAHDG